VRLVLYQRCELEIDGAGLMRWLLVCLVVVGCEHSVEKAGEVDAAHADTICDGGSACAEADEGFVEVDQGLGELGCVDDRDCQEEQYCVRPDVLGSAMMCSAEVCGHPAYPCDGGCLSDDPVGTCVGWGDLDRPCVLPSACILPSEACGGVTFAYNRRCPVADCAEMGQACETAHAFDGPASSEADRCWLEAVRAARAHVRIELNLVNGPNDFGGRIALNYLEGGQILVDQTIGYDGVTEVLQFGPVRLAPEAFEACLAEAGTARATCVLEALEPCTP
jgi:hypothetical protein